MFSINCYFQQIRQNKILKKMNDKKQSIKNLQAELDEDLYLDTLNFDIASNIKTIPSVKQKKRSVNLKATASHYIRWILNIFQGNTNQTQCEVFQSSIAITLLIGQSVGLFPVTGILDGDISKVRFTIRSLKFVYTFCMCMFQAIATILSIYSLVQIKFNLMRVALLSFYFSTCVNSILFMQVATKWQFILKQISSANLDNYIDINVSWKCKCITIIFIGIAIAEYVFFIIFRYAFILDCLTINTSVFQMFAETFYNWVFERELGIPYSIMTGILAPLINFLSAANWNISHVFIMCISMYLTSLLEQIVKNIEANMGKYMPASYWKNMREDYNRATRLIRTFDSVINRVIFASFANNLFFICLQVFYVTSHGAQVYIGISKCPHYPSGPFNGYEFIVYYAFTITLLIARFLSVAIITSRIYTTSLMVLPALYSVPSPSYCDEVSRFIEQVNGNNVALSGLNFFYVTKELILSMAGTIITYELVLLQYNTNDDPY